MKKRDGGKSKTEREKREREKNKETWIGGGEWHCLEDVDRREGMKWQGGRGEGES